jgi:hypothetical protein
MSTEKNVQIVKNFLAALGRRDKHLSIAKTLHAGRINHLATSWNSGVPIRFLP